MFSTTYMNLCCCCCLVAKSYLTLSQPHGLWPTKLLCPWDFPYKNTGVGCHFLLQGIFLTQGLWLNLNLFWCKDEMGSPGVSVLKNSPASSRDTCLIPGLGRAPEEGNGNPLQYSCLGNLTDRGAWRATVHGLTKELDTT